MTFMVYKGFVLRTWCFEFRGCKRFGPEDLGFWGLGF